jgi:demethylmenaquinone methyltransferase/2-methoxy-6-polyprenyl-1,4-benzoquinol methylase
MADWSAALREMARVLVPQGHLVVLDFSIPRLPLRAFYRFYLHRCLPTLAAFLTGQKDAYDYLGASIEKFPSGDLMLRLIESNSFANANAQEMTNGVVTIYTAEKLL